MKTYSILKDIFMLVSLIMLATIAVSGQESGDVSLEWRKMTPESSIQSLKEYMNYTKEYFNWEAALQEEYLDKGFRAAKLLKNDTLTYNFAYSLGNLYLAEDSLFSALNMFNEALEYTYNVEREAETYNILGFTFSTLEDYNTALDIYQKSLRLQPEKEKDGSAYVFNNISSTYGDLEDFESAIKYVKYSENLAKEFEFPEKEYIHVFNYTYLADYYSSLGKKDSVSYYIDLALQNVTAIDTIQGYKYQEAVKMAYIEAIDMFLYLGRNELASDYLQKIKQYTLTYSKVNALKLEARFEMQNQRYQAALAILESIDLNNQHFTEKEEVYELQIECYEQLNDREQAISLYKKLLALQKDKVKSDRNRDAVLADVKFETFKKNEEINTLKLDQEVKDLTIQNQQYLFILFIVLIFLLTGIVFSIYKQAERRKAKSRELQELVDLRTQDLTKANEELKILNYIASHDIKEPMRNIGNYVGLMKRKLPDDIKSDFAFYFDVVEKSVKQLYTLVEDIGTYLSMSNEDQFEKSYVDMNPLVSSLFFSLDTFTQERNGELINNGIPSMITSSTSMYVILKNLVENGLKFNESSSPTVEISYLTDQQNHKILVKDNGVGIDKEYHEQIFKSFKRLQNRSKYEGSGIGLAIVKLLIDKLGGSIEVESQPHQGSTFIISLPIITEEAE